MKDYTVTETVKLTGYPKSLINRKIMMGEIPVQNGRIPERIVNRILMENKTYISLTEFSKDHTTKSFNGRLTGDRKKLLDYLERNAFFGIEVVSYKKILMGTDVDRLYFRKTDVAHLETNLTEFFQYFAAGQKDIVKDLLKSDSKHATTCRYIKSYLSEYLFEKETPPAVTDFVKMMLSLPDISKLTTQDISEMMGKKMSISCKEHIVRFLNYCKARRKVHYQEVAMKSNPKNSIPAYSDETYIELMRCVFNADYIAEHNMIEKALQNHLYIETWLYLSLFLTCGWRAGDVCKGWKYPDLLHRENGFLGINKDTLYEDILYDRLPDSIYEDVCTYSLSSVIAAEMLPSKTNGYATTTLRDIIIPELYPFYGLLTLIAEAVMLKTGEGYMQENRASTYQNKMTLRGFFGKEINEILHGENIQSRRLNKDFLQGVENTAKQNGNGSLMASAVASYARNHTSLNTISSYLKDHTLNGENAEMVLYFMMERGVFGFEYYQTLLLAYPDAIKQLPMKKQNELIKEAKIDPMQLELNQAGLLAQSHIKEKFENGDTKEVTAILKDMFAISQTHGKAKEDGIYCLKRTRGEACAFPEYSSCIGNGCPHLVFTKHGFVPLVKILKSYMEASKNDKKAEAVLKQIIIPRYQDVINALIRDTGMNQAERNGIKLLMEEILHEQCTSANRI